MSQPLPHLSSPAFHLTTDCNLAAQLAICLFDQDVNLRVLQDSAELHDLLGRRPDHPAAPQTVLALAVLAWQQAAGMQQAAGSQQFASPGRPGSPAPAAGAALLTGRLADEGTGSSHPSVLAVQTTSATALWIGSIVSTGRSPSDSQREYQQTIQGLLAAAAGWLGRARREAASIEPSEAGIRVFTAQPDVSVAGLYENRQPCLWQSPGKLVQTSGPPGPFALLSGSFNPRHVGHVQLAEAAAAWLKRPVHFELPVINADKPPLDYLSLAERTRQFQGSWLALTAAAAFTEKAKLFPGTVFVVGADTAERILQPVYYGNSDEKMRAELANLDVLNCRFLVAARRAGGQLQTLSSLNVPPELCGLFEELPAAMFQLEMSSTLHRQQQKCPFSDPED